jgi:hypothetical protein
MMQRPNRAGFGRLQRKRLEMVAQRQYETFLQSESGCCGEAGYHDSASSAGKTSSDGDRTRFVDPGSWSKSALFRRGLEEAA